MQFIKHTNIVCANNRRSSLNVQACETWKRDSNVSSFSLHKIHEYLYRSCVLLCRSVKEQPNARTASEICSFIFHSECVHSLVPLHIHATVYTDEKYSCVQKVRKTTPFSFFFPDFRMHQTLSRFCFIYLSKSLENCDKNVFYIFNIIKILSNKPVSNK